MNSLIPATISVLQLIDWILLHFNQQITTGNFDNVHLPAEFKTIIGQKGLETLAIKYSELIGSPVEIIEDIDNCLLHFRRTSLPCLSITFPVQDKQRVTRPPNAFILYRSNRHPEIKRANPELCNNDISVIVGAEWNSAPAKIREEYQKLAESYKKQHAEDHPDYAYQPRKLRNKTSSSTSKKAATLAQSNIVSHVSALTMSTADNAIPTATNLSTTSIATELANPAEATITDTASISARTAAPSPIGAKSSAPALYLAQTQDETSVVAWNICTTSGSKISTPKPTAMPYGWYQATPRVLEMTSQGCRLIEDPVLPETEMAEVPRSRHCPSH